MPLTTISPSVAGPPTAGDRSRWLPTPVEVLLAVVAAAFIARTQLAG